MSTDNNIWETKGFKDTLKTLWWATQFGFRVSPPLYTFLFIQRFLSVGLPIAHAYFASLVVGELVRLLTASVDQISQHLVVWLALATVSLAAKGMNEHLWTYLCERYSQVYTLKAIGAYLERMVSLDAQYYEDASFKTLQDRAYNVLSWQIEATSNWIQDIVANLLGLGLIAGIFLRINPLFIPFGVEAADEPGSRIRQPLIVEVDRILGGEDNTETECPGLFQECQEGCLGGRILDWWKIAEDLVHIEECSQARRARLGSHPSEDFVEQHGYEKHPFRI